MSHSDSDDETVSSQSGEDLDHTPLTFGKYRGKTPSQISEIDPKYIVWMYENVTNRATCSYALAKDCGHSFPPTSSAKATDPTARTLADKIEQRRENPYRRKSFDDYDDDIPF